MSSASRSVLHKRVSLQGFVKEQAGSLGDQSCR